LQAGGKAEPTSEDIIKLLGTVGIDGDKDRITSLLSDLQGKDISQVN
jgi:large subunit ribosomal protein LP2